MISIYVSGSSARDGSDSELQSSSDRDPPTLDEVYTVAGWLANGWSPPLQRMNVSDRMSDRVSNCEHGYPTVLFRCY